MDGDGPVDFTAAAEETPERKLDLGGVPVRSCHAGEDLRGVIEAVVDEVIEAFVVIARQADGARRAVAATQKIGGQGHEAEGQRQKHRRQFEHAPEPSRLRALLISARCLRSAPRARTL